MARFFGESGAWADLRDSLAWTGVDLSGPQAIGPAHKALVQQREDMIAREDQELYAQVSVIESEISTLQAERRLLKKILNHFRIKQRRQDQEAAKRIAAQRIEHIDSTISALEDADGASEYIGALAEIRVIHHLEALPESFAVFSNVNLRAERFLRYRDTPVQTAQLDHVVLGDFGVFVIETKMWNAATANRDDVHNPFDQVGRASLLLHCMLKDRGLYVKVRSLIAADGVLPPAPPWAKVKALPARKLVGYIAYFQSHPMEDYEKMNIHEFLKSRTW
jgi:hypothetical protein